MAVALERQKPHPQANRSRCGERGFSMIEVAVVLAIALGVMAMAIVSLSPNLQLARSDDALRIVLAQMRQAREYSIDNRRYVQIAFPTVSSKPEVVLTQMNTLTPGAGATNPVLSTVWLPATMQYTLVSSLPDTPDGFGNSSAISFRIEGTGTTPSGSMYFQSDGELIDSVTDLPIDGTVFLGLSGNTSSARAVTVMGSTGRVRGWRAIGTGSNPSTAWQQF